MINISDHDAWMLFFFVMGIVTLFLLSIPIGFFLGFPWYTYTVKGLEGILFILCIIVGIIGIFSEGYEEAIGTLGAGLAYWQGFLLLLFSIGIGFGSLMLGDKMWQLKEKKKTMELAELKDRLGKGVITQEDYEQREKKLLKSDKMKGKIMLIVTFGVIIATIGEIFYLFPLQCIMLSLLGYGLFVLGTLYFGWKHPKWYVKVYTVLCFFWEIIYFFIALGSGFFGIAFFLVLVVGVTLPLIPVWYLMHVHGFSYEKYKCEPLRSEQAKVPRTTVGVLWGASQESEGQFKELKEQLDRGIITQDEYEELHSALSNLLTGIITKYEFEQKKKRLLEKSKGKMKLP